MIKGTARFGMVFAVGFLSWNAAFAATVAYYRFDGGNLVDSTGVTAHNGTVWAGGGLLVIAAPSRSTQSL